MTQPAHDITESDAYEATDRTFEAIDHLNVAFLSLRLAVAAIRRERLLNKCKFEAGFEAVNRISPVMAEVEAITKFLDEA